MSDPSATPEVIALRERHGFPACHAATDGDCNWAECPQLVTYRTGCPLYDWEDPDARF